MQIPYFARHFRVLVMDGLGNGRSDRCRDPRRYEPLEFARDCLAVMDATDTERAVMASLSTGAQYQLELARAGARAGGGRGLRRPCVPLHPLEPLALRAIHWCGGCSRTRCTLPTPVPPVGTHEPGALARGSPPFADWFISRCLPEPHSTKPIEDGVGWALDTDRRHSPPRRHGQFIRDRRTLRTLAQNLDCPVLVVPGERDKITPPRDARALARLSGGKLELVPGAGHFRTRASRSGSTWRCASSPRTPSGVTRTPRDPTVYRPDGRPRALFVSSPIGLGHAQRDVAIARELRRLHPDLQIDWLAQDPVTRMLEAEGERIHPASPHLANESKHIESESAEHDLHCFHAIRRMDEILAANFMLFHDVVREERYDLWIGDEAWELDYYLHENPREKRVPYAWLTDFVGFLPMDDGTTRERFLTADYNAEMVDHIAEHPEVRDLALFVGNPEDIVPERLGPELPMIRDWTERHFDFTGYVTGFDPADLGERTKLRAELGYGDDEQVCIVTVGGSGVGADLLRRVIAAFPQAKERVPDLRMIVVAGPRIDPASLPSHAGPRGGPLRAQPLPAPGRLRPGRRAGRSDHLDGADRAEAAVPVLPAAPPLRAELPRSPPARTLRRRSPHGLRRLAAASEIAEAIAEEIGREVDYRDVEIDGAARAARRIAELLN